MEEPASDLDTSNEINYPSIQCRDENVNKTFGNYPKKREKWLKDGSFRSTDEKYSIPVDIKHKDLKTARFKDIRVLHKQLFLLDEGMFPYFSVIFFICANLFS